MRPTGLGRDLIVDPFDRSSASCDHPDLEGVPDLIQKTADLLRCLVGTAKCGIRVALSMQP